MLLVLIEASCSTSRDARQINFRVVHLVAQVAALAPCRSVPADSVEANARRYGTIGIGPAGKGSP